MGRPTRAELLKGRRLNRAVVRAFVEELTRLDVLPADGYDWSEADARRFARALVVTAAAAGMRDEYERRHAQAVATRDDVTWAEG